MTSTSFEYHGPDQPAVRLLLVDIHAISRRSSRLMLDALPGLLVVGETSALVEALALAASEKPDVVLLSNRVQGSSGPDTARTFTQKFPAIKIVFLTLFDDAEYVQAALQAGAVGYVLKQEPAARVQEAIASVMRGERYLSPGLHLEHKV
jgi:two-component system nitrate/nitrite response regulator NarL